MPMVQVPPARYLQRAKDLVDSRYAEQITVDDLARWSGSIAYEILTRLGSRYPRLYSAFDS